MDTLAARKQTLLTAGERRQRRAERQHQVLRFLREEIWSSTELLGKVMSIKTPQGIHKALVSIEKEGLISRMPVSICGRLALSIWGITPQGQALAFDLESEDPISAYFEPSRLSLSGMDHHLDVQRTRLQAFDAGWGDWLPGSRLGHPHRRASDPMRLLVTLLV